MGRLQCRLCRAAFITVEAARQSTFRCPGEALAHGLTREHRTFPRSGDRSCASWGCEEPDPNHYHGPDPYCDVLNCRLCCHACDCDVCTGALHVPHLTVLTDIPEHELNQTPRRRRARMKKALAELSAGDYVRAEGVDTRGHGVVRTGYLLAQPKEVTAQRNGTRTRGWRLFVGAAGTSIDQRSTWVTLFPGAGTVERAKAPEVGEWQQTPFGEIPGARSSPDVNVLVLFGGKGGKRSKEPTQSTLARLVHNPEKHHYEVRDAATGETLLCPSWQTVIWWAVAPTEDEHDNPAAEPAPTEETAAPWREMAEGTTPLSSIVFLDEVMAMVSRCFTRRQARPWGTCGRLVMRLANGDSRR